MSIAPATALCWRATFIDEVVDEEISRKGRRTRATSAPAARTSGGDAARAAAEELFADEREYIATLSKRVATLRKGPALAGECSSAEESPLFSSEDSFEQDFEPQAELVLLAEAPLAVSTQEIAFAPLAPTLEVQQQNCFVSSMLLQAKAEAATTTVGAGSGAGSDGVATTQAPLSREEASREADGSSSLGGSLEVGAAGADNMGSIGHPYLCSRPCLYFMSGQCANGRSCEYCHVPHLKRPTHLEKKHREQLRDLPPLKAKELLLPIIREKVVGFDGSDDSLAAFANLAQACGLSERVASRSGHQALRLARSERSLGVALRGMSLRLLLLTLQRGVLQDDQQAHDAAEALLDQLRESAISATAKSQQQRGTAAAAPATLVML